MAGQTLTEIYAARPILGSQTAKDDLFYTADVSLAGINKDRGITRNELLRAMAAGARVGASSYFVPFLGAITGLTGGGATKLDGILDGVLLADVQVPFCVDLSLADDLSRWKLRLAGSDVADGVSFISPTEANFAGYLFVRIL